MARTPKFSPEKKRAFMGGLAQSTVVLPVSVLGGQHPHISTGIPELDKLIGGRVNSAGIVPCPGIPRGWVTQMWGEKDTGKMTVALCIAASTIRQGGTALYIDFNNDVVPECATHLGIPFEDSSKFRLCHPQSLEEGIKAAHAGILAGVDLVVFDCLNVAVPKQFVHDDPDDPDEFFREQQRVWSDNLHNLKMTASRSGTALLGTAVVENALNPPNTGQAWKFCASVRLVLTRTETPGIVQCKAVKCGVSSSQGLEVLIDLAGDTAPPPT